MRQGNPRQLQSSVALPAFPHLYSLTSVIPRSIHAFFSPFREDLDGEKQSILVVSGGTEDLGVCICGSKFSPSSLFMNSSLQIVYLLKCVCNLQINIQGNSPAWTYAEQQTSLVRNFPS